MYLATFKKHITLRNLNIFVQEASDPQPVSADDKAESYRTSLDKAMLAYVKQHYPEGVVNVGFNIVFNLCIHALLTIMYLVACYFVLFFPIFFCKLKLLKNSFHSEPMVISHLNVIYLTFVLVMLVFVFPKLSWLVKFVPFIDTFICLNITYNYNYRLVTFSIVKMKYRISLLRMHP